MMMLQSSATYKYLISRLGIVFLGVCPKAGQTREMPAVLFRETGIFKGIK